MEELKPCPFCGGDVELSTYNNGEGYVIECKNHEWSRQLSHASDIAGDIDMVSWGLGDDARNALIEAWNTRAERTCKMTKKGPEYVLGGWFECSECGVVYPPCNDDISAWALQYCPRCGAKVVE